GAPCDFMTWDVPVKDDCPECGMTMFKKSGRGAKKPYCVNEECPNFTPEDKRGGYKKKVATTTAEGETPAEDAKKPAKKPAAKKAAAKKPAAKKPAAKKPAAKKAVAKKPAAKKPAAKKAPAKKPTT
ncbi:MAG: DNA topoisomerase I, partial [Oscillospiraceae bacterium]